jgi:hypothetical protein
MPAGIIFKALLENNRMNYSQIIGALLIGLVFTLIFSVGLKNKGPWGTLWFTFFILALASLAGQLCIQPVGPSVFGVFLFPSIFIAILIAFSLAAVSYTSLPAEKNEPEPPARVLPEALGIFFWLLLLVLLVAIGVGYYRLP